ncbi:TIGR04076 family protein [Spirochaetota bacterium]
MEKDKNVPEEKTAEDFVRHIIETENRYYQEVKIVKVSGECPYGHKEGETYSVTNCNHDSICGALYKSIHSSIITQHYGGILPWEKTKGLFKGLCPEEGRVQVEVKRFEKDDFTFLKTRTQAKSMLGKGFPVIEKYTHFLEIIDVANDCAWGHKEGQCFEIDPFNPGGVCGYLYARVYDFLNLYFSGADLPWEGEKNIMNSFCPDSYNLVSFRIIRKKREID